MNFNIPQFLPIVDPNEHDNHMTNFDVEMLQCTNSDRIRSRYVNILHFSTDLDGGRHEMDRIAQFMKDEGYDVRHQTDPQLWRDADVIIVGSATAQLKDVEYIIHTSLKQGLMLHWDVLHYGMDYDPRSVLPFGTQVLYSNNIFSTYGICLVVAHIIRRGDHMTLIGLHTSMLTEIENYINIILGTAESYSADKIKRFKDKINAYGHWGPDAELFFAAVNMIRSGRNIASHPQANAPTKLNKRIITWSRRITAFYNLAKKYNRLIRSPPLNQHIEVNIHLFFKWEIVIARATIAWVSDYKDMTLK